MTSRTLVSALATLSLLVTVACGDDDGDTTTNNNNTGGQSAQGGAGGEGEGGAGEGGSTGGDDATVDLSLSGLEPLGDGYVYEGWFIVDGAPVTTGRFQIEAGTDDYEFAVNAADSEAATAFVLTIEPDEGDDPAPSAVHVLAGDITDGAADLTVGHAAALNTDFATMEGSYILETPSSAAAADFDQGIWWLMMGTGGPEASLTLPELPEGWVYEGWVVGTEGPVSTGRFTTAAGADSDDGGPTAGPDATPPYPGQDFIDPAVVLTDLTAVISVEPDPDDSPAPFALKPLIDATVEDLGAGVSQDMTNMSANNPTGSVTITLAN